MAILGKEAEAIVSLIGEVNSSIQKMGGGWFSSGRDIELYQVQSRSLGDRLNTWSGLVHSHGLNDHDAVKPVLELADSTMKCLEKEAAHLKELRHSCCSRYKSFIMRSFSPRDLSPKLKIVGTAFRTLEVPSLLEEIMKANKIRDENHWAKPSTLAFSRDGRYVPIQQTVEEVIEALERKDGPQVVTLSGGAGTGKTTLVKALALAYQKKTKGMVAIDLSDGGVGESGRFFVNGIVYLACGNEADSKLKIVELLHSLGSYLQVSNEDYKESESHTEEVLRRRLSARLAEQEILVILDDVEDSEFLQRFLIAGKKVKYLVTTCNSGLRAGDFSNHNIVMQKPELKVAEAIFLQHMVDPPDEIISSTEIQELASEMIKEAEDNPVVLKNFAVAISGVGKLAGRDLEFWQSVEKKFQELMARQQLRNGIIDHTEGQHRKRVLCSFELAMDSMPVEAQHLLLLAAHCEGPLVPEVVLNLLHRSTLKGPLNSFLNWTNYVEKRDFIKLHQFVVPWCKSHKRLWSIQSLQFISHKIATSGEEVNTLTDSLLADHPQARPAGSGDSFCADDKLVAGLCFVYGEKKLSAKAAIKLTIMTPSEGRGFLRLAVEPVVWLLHCDHEIEEEWEQKAYWSARGVLMTYISEGKLDDVSAQTLLSIPQTAPAMCKMLQIIGEISETSILTADTPLTLQSLLKLLTRDADPTFELQKRAAETLASLADKSHRVIVADVCVLERLMRLLAKDVKSPGQAGAALALGKLAVTDEIRGKIATYPGIMPKLVELMDQENECQVQENAAYALSRLALNSQNVHKIVDFSGSLKKFSFLLSMVVNTAVQVQAAKALANLARVEKVTQRILGHSGILGSAVRLLDEDMGSGVQFQASRLLLNLSTSCDNQSKICKHPGAVTTLVALLKPGCLSLSSIYPHLESVQENAVKILANLSSSKDCKSAIVGTPDALKYLFGLAGNDAQLELQKYATKCLSNLAPTALEADRSRAIACTSLNPEERQMLTELIAGKCNSAAGSKRHDLQSNGDSSGMNNNGDPEDGWAVVRVIKNRWCKMLRFRLTLSPRRRTQSIRDDPTGSPLPVSTPRGGLIEVQLPPTPAFTASYPRNGEIEPSLSMKERVMAASSSFKSPER